MIFMCYLFISLLWSLLFCNTISQLVNHRERRCFPSYILMSAYVGTCVFVALLGDGKCMMMSANGDDSVCFPCLSKCE